MMMTSEMWCVLVDRLPSNLRVIAGLHLRSDQTFAQIASAISYTKASSRVHYPKHVITTYINIHVRHANTPGAYIRSVHWAFSAGTAFRDIFSTINNWFRYLKVQLQFVWHYSACLISWHWFHNFLIWYIIIWNKKIN